MENDSGACFLCALDTRPCAVARVEGTLLGARFDDRFAPPRPQIGLRTRDGERLLVTLGPGSAGLVRRLMTIAPDVLRRLRVRAMHMEEIALPPPAPGKAPFRQFLALPAGIAILEPDLLINITDLSQANYCIRQEVLRRMTPSAPNAAGLRGTAIHAVFKEMLKDPAADHQQVLEATIAGMAPQLAEVNATEDEIRQEAAAHLDHLAQWRDTMRDQLWASAPTVRAETFLLAPEIGMKGRLDILWEDAEGDERRILELKTGGGRGELPKSDHRWQVYGYQALLAARRNGHLHGAPQATILYSNTPAGAVAYPIAGSLREMQRVVEIRNELALIRATGTVPLPPGGMRCERCSIRPDCAGMSALLHWPPPPGEAPPPPADADAAWFRHWEALQRAEARSGEAEVRTLWADSAAERIAAGTAVGDLTLLEPARMTDKHEWIYSFECVNTSELREGDEVLLSDGDPVRGEAVSGSVLEVSAGALTVWAREHLDHPRLIDRYGADVVAQRMLRNLVRWLRVDDHRRALVRGAVAPRFNPEATLPDFLPDRDLNVEQYAAVKRALLMQDYLLIQGPPGTGKTKVIAGIARMLLRRGYRVALAAFTNQATDTMLARVVGAEPLNALRLGHEYAVTKDLSHLRLVPRARAATGSQQPTATQMRELLHSVPLVAATVATWSAEGRDVEQTMPLFDVVIIDEATQLTVPAIVGALRWAKKFILVGDERQLPPLVQDEAARAGGLGESLFAALLRVAPPEAVVALRRQYRMHAAISAFPSQRFYGGALEADDSVARATLAITPRRHAALLDPQRPLVWVDLLEGRNEAPKINAAEAAAVADLVRALVESGVSPPQIGVIAPFRAQVARLRQLLGDVIERGATVDTVDRFQGGERDVILLTLVAATAPSLTSPLAGFLADEHRLNVALTRARRKLIVVGHRLAFGELPILRDLADHCAATDALIAWPGAGAAAH